MIPAEDLQARLQETFGAAITVEDIDMGGVPVAGDGAGDAGSDDQDTGGELPPPDFDGPDGPPDPQGGPDGDGDQGPEDPVALAAKQPLNDVGNGRRFAIHHGRDLMYVAQLDRWFVWAGTHYAEDEKALRVLERAQTMHELIALEERHVDVAGVVSVLIAREGKLRAREEELILLPEGQRPEGYEAELKQVTGELEKARKRLAKHKAVAGHLKAFALASGNGDKIKNMIDQSRTRLSVPIGDLDSNPLELNTLSGLLRFRVEVEGGRKRAEVEVLAHDRARRITKLAPFAYDPDAACDLWVAFLERVLPDLAMRQFVQRWLGLNALGLKSSKMAIFYGDGANGKSVLVDTIARLLGNYAATMKIETITGDNKRGGADATPDLIPLINARLVRTSEPEKGVALQEGIVKAMTGGEPIPVRPNYGSQIEIDPFFKITMGSNYKPEISGTDMGIWRRILLVPFSVTIPESEQDERFVEKLLSREGAGIMAWLVQGALMVLEQGLAPPASVQEATGEYREDSDPLNAFLMMACEVTGDAGDVIQSREMVDAINYYFIERGWNTRQPTSLTKQVATKSRVWKHPHTGKRFDKGKSSLSQYEGIRLARDFAARFRAAPRDRDGRPVGVAASASAAPPDPLNDF
ncbi:DNA primase family protein [Rubellimicrobium aerolatum]|uniref:Phage/plasmid primase, P4 family n=1 Tax=Rubellimicrobium aerolatum TaxID=490979 RepID=A0ABW0SEW3_9RHOB|nr:phage/plasmid primase, P4 family [Rubellimicrobium aerolatum]MBP1806473.1 putative DNA primase/helicase [Rubellimicrobium aerolatum]